jgi:DNA-binding PadR family transcriptional regulator
MGKIPPSIVECQCCFSEDAGADVGERTLNATAASLLGFLHDGPLTGWDLVALAEQRIGDFWSLTPSQVYRELAAMATAGLIEAGERGPRDRQPYAITDAGHAAFQAWVERDPPPETIRFPLLLTMLFGRHVEPARLAEIIASQRAIHAERLDSYARTDASIPPAYRAADPFPVATLNFGIAYERAVLSWFDGLPDSITQGTGDDDERQRNEA